MASSDETPWTEEIGDIFEGVSYEEEPSESEEDLTGNVTDELHDFLSESPFEESEEGVMSKTDYEDVVLDSAEASDSRLELIRRVHPDHHGSNELFRAHERLKSDGILDEYFEPKEQENNTEESNIEEEPYEPLGLPGFQNNEYQEALDISPDHETALELLEYDGNVEIARKVLETEWKIENAAEYITSNMFSKGSLAGEAELILSELEEDDRKNTVKHLVEENRIYEKKSENITTTWFQNDTLMGYDQEKGHNVRLDFYDDIKTSVDKNQGSLSSMIEETKEGLENYEIASLKSVYDADGQIDNRELESHIKSII